MNTVRVIGAGLAGSAAAIAARQRGAGVELFEKSRFPRHKVCGEYLSPEVEPVLRSLGVWDAFAAAGPARISRLALRFPRSEKRCRLPESAFGLSRYVLDEMLLRHAVKTGAEYRNEAGVAQGPTVIAHGRKIASVRGGRLFGFKAHYEGPANDAIELYFFDGCYVGVNAVEGGLTNVCGLGPEHVLSRFGFDFDALVDSCEKLRERLQPLNRKWRWLSVGPLVFQNRFAGAGGDAYLAGDALSFVDPFTGSGMLSALVSGRLAGIAAAERTQVPRYLADCRTRLAKPYWFSSLFRDLLASGWGERLTTLAPGPLLVWVTRPHRVI